MEESTCHEMVIWLLKPFSCMIFFFFDFLHFLISFKREVYVDAESMSHVTHIKHVFFHFVVYRF